MASPKRHGSHAPGAAQREAQAASTTGALVTVELGPRQLAWLDAIAEVQRCSREDVLRAALSWFSAKESARVQRTKRYAAIKLAARADQFDPLSAYLAGRDVVVP